MLTPRNGTVEHIPWPPNRACGLRRLAEAALARLLLPAAARQITGKAQSLR
jgi:hypothetical protein